MSGVFGDRTGPQTRRLVADGLIAAREQLSYSLITFRPTHVDSNNRPENSIEAWDGLIKQCGRVRDTVDAVERIARAIKARLEAEDE